MSMFSKLSMHVVKYGHCVPGGLFVFVFLWLLCFLFIYFFFFRKFCCHCLEDFWWGLKSTLCTLWNLTDSFFWSNQKPPAIHVLLTNCFSFTWAAAFVPNLHFSSLAWCDIPMSLMIKSILHYLILSFQEI